MNVNSLVEQLNLNVVSGKDSLDKQINGCFIGDLLSVAMGKAKEGNAWITIQSHYNIVAVATLVGTSCIIVTEGFEVEQTAIEKADEELIPILTTNLSTYEIAKKLSELGI